MDFGAYASQVQLRREAGRDGGQAIEAGGADVPDLVEVFFPHQVMAVYFD